MDVRTAVSVLILEDEALIALDVEYTLSTAGYNVLHTISSCVDALEWLENNSPDVVVMDVELRDGTCEKVAETLYARNIPVVIHSGRDPQDHAASFPGGRWVPKPSLPRALSEAVAESLSVI